MAGLMDMSADELEERCAAFLHRQATAGLLDGAETAPTEPAPKRSRAKKE
jgi:hypothetical protein